MKTEHTPGPWKEGRDDMATQSTVYGKWIYAGDKYCAMVQDNGNWRETMANARLIAAAPDLLAACELAAQHHQGSSSEPGRVLRAAIAKACPAPVPTEAEYSYWREHEDSRLIWRIHEAYDAGVSFSKDGKNWVAFAGYSDMEIRELCTQCEEPTQIEKLSPPTPYVPGSGPNPNPSIRNMVG